MRLIDLGSDVAYEDGLEKMRHTMARVDDEGPALLLIEHRPTITITRRGGVGAFVSPRERIEADGIDVVEADRGGDVTYHGPGQLTGYPILRLGPQSLGVDVVGFVRDMEAAIVDVVKGFGAESARHVEGKDAAGNVLTGVWVDAPVVSDETLGCNFHQVEHRTAKVCAIGVGLGGGITRHGFALNVTTRLEDYTAHIVPCGLRGLEVTSLERILMRPPSMDLVRQRVLEAVSRRLMPWHRPL